MAGGAMWYIYICEVYSRVTTTLLAGGAMWYILIIQIFTLNFNLLSGD
jgi:hypothetical protein